MNEPHGKRLDLRTVFGLQATVARSAADTGGAYVEMDVMAEPGSRTTIHYHPEQEETYQVVEGTLEVFHNAGWQAVPAGQSLTIPPKAVHGFRNASDGPVRFLNVHRPALAFQEHLETLARLARTGKIKGTRDPRSLIYMSMSAIRYQPDVTVKPPQRLVRSLAFIGQRLGFKLDDPAGD
ncbi:MAG: cupin domain-containing protein [Chloroflexota bacterium]|nr:cupin domain-containing protein [Chloroflexota bacterium]